MAEEYGAITQSIGAFTIKGDWTGEELTFIDTPGHEAFENLRRRGAQVTDLVVIVVSASDGVQPQTLECLALVERYSIPFVIAINKIDQEGADPQRVMAELQSYGVMPSPLGGDVPCILISALQKTNLEELEEALVQTAKAKARLREDFSCHAQCFVIETGYKDHVIKATVVVKRGTLKVDDYFVCGAQDGKVRVIRNDKGQHIK